MIRIGLCGAGFMGKMHAACYANMPDVKLVAVADVQPEVAKAVASPAGARTFTRAKDLIARADVDVVDICLPTYLHAEHAIQAAGRGLNCLCEKPIARNVEQATAMVKAVRKARVTFMVAHVIRFWPEYQVLKKAIDSRSFGKLKGLFLRRFGGKPDGWNKWFHKGALSGGALLDLHIHDTDYVMHLFGKPKSLDSVGVRTKGEFDQVSTNFAYPDVLVSAVGGWWPTPEPFDMAFRAVFDKAVLSYSSRFEPLTCHQEGKGSVAMKVPQPKTGKVDAGGNISSLGGYFNETRYFIDCLKKGEEPSVVTPEDALESLKVIEREFASASRK